LRHGLHAQRLLRRLLLEQLHARVLLPKQLHARVLLLERLHAQVLLLTLQRMHHWRQQLLWVLLLLRLLLCLLLLNLLLLRLLLSLQQLLARQPPEQLLVLLLCARLLHQLMQGAEQGSLLSGCPQEEGLYLVISDAQLPCQAHHSGRHHLSLLLGGVGPSCRRRYCGRPVVLLLP
jgi:hypothetical protein